MIDGAWLRKTGVALLASRLSRLGYDPCGGSEVVLWEDVRILEAAGIPVRVYGRAARDGMGVRILPFHGRIAQLHTIEYIRALLRSEPEAPILSYNEPAVAGSVPHRAIVRFDWGTPLPRYWNWPGWASRFKRARYLFPSKSERRLFLQRHARIPPSRAFVISNAVDLELFQPTERSLQRPSHGSVRVGFAGQWSEGKGIEQLLDAWRTLRAILPSCELYLAGGPSLWKNVCGIAERGRFSARIRQMGEEGLLRWVGELSRSAMPEFWNSIDVAVVPSLYEPFGLVALEALACGVPVVASAAGGLQEIILDGECGLLVPPGDTAALVGALCSLIEDESLRLRLAAGARLRARKFSLQRRSCELLDLLTGTAHGLATDAALAASV